MQRNIANMWGNGTHGLMSKLELLPKLRFLLLKYITLSLLHLNAVSLNHQI